MIGSMTGTAIATVLVWLADDPVPKDDDVVAGGWGALVFVALIVGTALLLWSFTRQMKKIKANAEAGTFDEEPKRPATSDGA